MGLDPYICFLAGAAEQAVALVVVEEGEGVG